MKKYFGATLILTLLCLGCGYKSPMAASQQPSEQFPLLRNLCRIPQIQGTGHVNGPGQRRRLRTRSST